MSESRTHWLVPVADFIHWMAAGFRFSAPAGALIDPAGGIGHHGEWTIIMTAPTNAEIRDRCDSATRSRCKI